MGSLSFCIGKMSHHSSSCFWKTTLGLWQQLHPNQTLTLDICRENSCGVCTTVLNGIHGRMDPWTPWNESATESKPSLKSIEKNVRPCALCVICWPSDVTSMYTKSPGPGMQCALERVLLVNGKPFDNKLDCQRFVVFHRQCCQRSTPP